MSTFECQHCGLSFNVPQATLDKYPSWQPKTCLRCRTPVNSLAGQPGGTRSRRPSAPGMKRPGGMLTRRDGAEGTLTLSQVLETYTDGPTTGVFTDGAAHPNPGPGGWGAVYVVENEIVAQEYG